MCGITGFWDRDAKRSHAEMEHILHAMNDTLALRGPDGSGAFVDAKHGIALGHRRLAILDLSPAGAQPMHSPSGRYTIVFNGEVYNAGVLRPDLLNKGYTFKGTSDTEVMLAMIEEYGLEHAVKQFMGMFAFALFDHKEHTLHLVRDRLGVKPLYVATMRTSLLFASTLKAFSHHPDFQKRMDRQSLAAYFARNYMPGNHCIFQDVQKVQPGQILTFNKDHGVHITTYWSLENVAARGVDLSLNHDNNVIDQLEDLLLDATGLRMIADVPLGAFLSGGIDSSLVVALMQKKSSIPVKTFSIGFEEADFNEAIYAKDVAKHLGTDHTEFYVGEKDALAVIPNLPDFFDEPFADSSQIPTYLVSHLARKHVTVALSGDGGDEFFAGYTRYSVSLKFWNIYRRMPKPARALLSSLISGLPEKSWDAVGKVMGRALPLGSLAKGLGEKLHRIRHVLNAHNAGSLYEGLLSLWNAEDLYSLTGYVDTSFDVPWNCFEGQGFLRQMQLFDSATYLPDDILTKVDRASMAASLEARGPLLDHRIAEFAFSLPEHFKVREGKTKWILRQILNRHVPRHLFERPKQGFGVPLESWLQGPLRPWAEDLLSPHKLRDTGISNLAPIQHRLKALMEGKRNWSYSLWGILMYQAWHEKHMKE